MPDERLSMAEQLSAGWDKLEADNAETGGSAGDQGLVADTGRQDGVAADTDRQDADDKRSVAERARDAEGKFAKEDKPREKLTLKKEPTNAAAKPEREAPGKGAGQEVDRAPVAAQPGETGQAKADIIPPPQHWAGKDKIEWERLPYHVKQAVAADYNGVAELRALAPVLEPLKQRLTQEFGGVDRGVGAILQTWQFARQSPVDFAKQFIQQFRIDPQALGFGGASQQQQPGGNAAEQQFADPALTTLQQRLEAIEAQSRQESEARATQQQNQIHADIQAFGSEADPKSGTLAHPYFNDVRQNMGGLMATGQAKTLKEAYDMACWAVPAIRTNLLAAERTAEAVKRKEAVKKASAAGGSIAGSPGVARGEVHVRQSARADLEKNWDAMEARV